MSATQDEGLLNDCLNKADVRAAALQAESDRWRALLVRVVGEVTAERMFRNQDQ